MTLGDLIPSGMTPDDVIVLATALGATVTVFAIWQGLLVRDPVTPRIRALEQRRLQLKAGMLAGSGNRARDRSGVGVMGEVVRRLQLLRSRDAENAAKALARAGIRSQDAVVTFLFLRLALPAVFGIAAMFVILWAKLIVVPEPYALPACLALTLLGAAAPKIYLKNAADKRRAALQKGLPDALDLMVICAECGLSLDSTLDRVSREIAPSAPELADELGLTAAELSFLPDRRQALDNLNDRTDLASIRGVVNTLKQTEKFGTPLAQSLRVLGAEYRTDRLMKAEEKAARLPAILTVPMIVFILPTLFVVLMGPAIIKVLNL